MNTPLKNDLEHLSEILNHTMEVAQQHFDRRETLPPSQFIPNMPMVNLPDKGIGAIATLDHFENNFAHKLANSAGPRYFGFVVGGSTPASVAGDWLVSAYDQNVGGSTDSIAPHIERQTINFFKELFGLDPEYFGCFVTGATMANFASLAIARQWVGEQRGIDYSNEGLDGVPIKIVSGTPHSSIIKSLSMLGVGRNSVVKVETLPDREAVDIESLENVLKEINGPVIVVGNAGTVNTVDFDDLEAIGKLKKKYNFWLHVDAAFGGFAGCSEKYAHLVNGINHADSITVDAHKWLNVPYDAAMQFTKHRSIQVRVFQNYASYLGAAEKSQDYFHCTPENSRRFRALPAWFTLMAYGKEGHREIVERNCDSAHYFGELIKSSDDFKLLAPVKMNVVCFTLQDELLTTDLIQKFLDTIRDDGRVFFTPTQYKGTPAIRAAVSNWLTNRRDMEVAFEIISSINQKIKGSTMNV